MHPVLYTQAAYLKLLTAPGMHCSGHAGIKHEPTSQDTQADRVPQLQRQLVGNLDEVTDLRLLGPAGQQGPFTHVAVATNSPTVRLFQLAPLGCSASLDGVHTDTILALDVACLPDPRTPGGPGASPVSMTWVILPGASKRCARPEQGCVLAIHDAAASVATSIKLCVHKLQTRLLLTLHAAEMRD